MWLKISWRNFGKIFLTEKWMTTTLLTPCTGTLCELQCKHMKRFINCFHSACHISVVQIILTIILHIPLYSSYFFIQLCGLMENLKAANRFYSHLIFIKHMWVSLEVPWESWWFKPTSGDYLPDLRTSKGLPADALTTLTFLTLGSG